MADDVVKRLRYFNGQFLQAQDFNDEQAYHLDRQRRHNKHFHTSGIVHDLSVSVSGTTATVNPGTAVNGEGQLIVLNSSRPLNLADRPDQTLLLVISYDETTSDEAQVGKKEDTRLHENPRVEAVADTAEAPPASTHIRLARLTTDAGGEIQSRDDSVRIQAGVRIGDEIEVRRLRFGRDTGTRPELASGASGRLDLTGSLRVTGNATLGGQLNVTGNSTLNGQLNVTGNVGIGTSDPAHGLHISAGRSVRIELGSGQRLSLGATGAFAIDAAGVAGGRLTVTNSGNVGIGTANPEAPLHVANHLAVGPFAATSGQGIINVTGAAAEFGFARRTLSTWPATPQAGDRFVWYNPDGTARLSTHQRGDLLTVTNTGNVGIGTATPQAKVHVEGTLRVNGDFQLPNTGSQFARFTNTTFDNESNFQNNNVKLQMGSRGPVIAPAAPYEFAIGHSQTFLATFPNQPTTNFIKVFSINQNGDLFIAGGKSGYVVDHFVNKGGDALEQGDVVVLGGQQASLYFGADNNIPIPEVDLTDRAYDTRVCGIVARVVTEQDLPYVAMEQPGRPEAPAAGEEQSAPLATQPQRSKDSAAGSETAQPYLHPLQQFAAAAGDVVDVTKVEDQQLGKMVTLGAFAHCKVDADIAPIAAGDLLTTSPTKGCAQKVLEPQKAIGAIIGKALGTLESGKGKIPVLVLLQ